MFDLGEAPSLFGGESRVIINLLTIYKEFVLKAIVLLYESGANSIMVSIAYHYALSRRGNKRKSNDGTLKVLLEDSSSLPIKTKYGEEVKAQTKIK